MSISCVRCSYSITEPLCSSCILNEIKIWFYGQPIKKEVLKKINSELKNLLKEIEMLDYVLPPSENIWDALIARCIKCKKGVPLICFYCVTNQASRIVKNNLNSESCIESFHESFNMEPYDYKLNKEKNSLFAQ